MGLLKIHDYGNFDSLHLSYYQQVYHNFDIWWDETVSHWIVEHLTSIIRLKVNDEEIKNQIKRFRGDINISIDDEITQQDIIRFKSLNVVKWLYTTFIENFKVIIGHQLTFHMANLLEAAVSSSLDSISFITEVANNMYNYNTFVERLIHSVAIRLRIFNGFTNKVKRRYIAAVVIQRQWRKSIVDPDYLVCRKRLMKEFETM